MALSQEDAERYNRQIILPEIGAAGQEKISAAKIAVVGAGGLGTPALTYLAAAGVGTLGIIDGDRVARTNLGRQILYETADVGRPKTDAAHDRLYDLNPDIAFRPHPVMLTPANAHTLLSGYDMVLDGCDDFNTRFTIAEATYRLAIPHISGAVQGFSGMVSCFVPHLGPPHPCYRCLVAEFPSQAAQCAAQGIVGPVAGVIGCLMAQETLNVVLGIAAPLSGKILRYDGKAQRFHESALPRDPECVLCAS